MSSKSNDLSTALLDLLFLNNITALSILDDISDGIVASTTAGSLYISLHTDDVGEAGNQTTNEANFGSYARIPVARSGSGWTLGSQAVSNAAQIAFAKATTDANNPNVLKFLAIGTDATGAGNVLYSGHLGTAAESFNGESTGDVITVKNTTFVDGNQVFVFAGPGDTLPTGIARGFYYIISTSGDTHQLSLTSGGAAVTITADGQGQIGKVVERSIDTDETFVIEIGDLDISED